jgi:hypothetical protein
MVVMAVDIVDKPPLAIIPPTECQLEASRGSADHHKGRLTTIRVSRP